MWLDGRLVLTSCPSPPVCCERACIGQLRGGGWGGEREREGERESEGERERGGGRGGGGERGYNFGPLGKDGDTGRHLLAFWCAPEAGST
jgi:hypothetical protein